MFQATHEFWFELSALPRGFQVGYAALIGAVIGSFLTVVIHRLPIMLQRARRVEGAGCQSPSVAGVGKARYNLCVPRSACPSCGHTLRVWENVPVFSYLALRGRCGACGTSIPVRYVLTEITTAAFAGISVEHFGLTAQAGLAFVLAAALLALTFVWRRRAASP
jgi:leader peptidase (prepilin peptidase)/N-methyltransferase